MKKLTYSSMAAARLRANKRQYMSLALGIFLAIFLVTTLFLAAQGFILAQAEQTNRNVGKLDAFLVDAPDVSDETLWNFDLITEVGHVYVTASVEETGSYLGYYDATATEHMYRTILEGRMPKSAGEIAIEQSELLALDLDRNWKIGDSVVLSLIPIDGQTEERTFTLVGILNDQADKLDAYKNTHTSEEYVKQFPALLTSQEEEEFNSGRIAVHRTFLIEGGKLADPYINKFYDAVTMDGATSIAGWGHFYAISAAGYLNHMDEFWTGFASGEGVLMTLIMGALLGIALLISCGVGIASAMESILTKRSEEIGLLRVVGATQQQIRRIFGRESLILAVIIAPLSMILSIGAVGIFSLIVPDQMILKLNPVLLIPIFVISILLVALFGYLPLRRYAKQMPMSVIRDTDILRKIKHIKSKKQFRVANLISTRLLRLYPSRQIGSAILVALMLFCVVCSIMCVNVASPYVAQDTAAFSIITQSNGVAGYVSILRYPPLTDQSLSQIRKLPHVSHVEIERYLGITVLLDEKSDYLTVGHNVISNETISPIDVVDNSADKQYDEVRSIIGTDKELANLIIHTVVLDEDNLLKYSGWIEDGEIDIEAINAGREVIVCAPKIWNGVDIQGYSYSTYGPEPPDKNAVLVAENDCFYAGQNLPLIQLYSEEISEDDVSAVNGAQRLDTTVTVGAVLNDYDGVRWTNATILTTEEGLRNMGLYANGQDTYKIYLDGEVDLQTEEFLEQYLEAIGSRAGEIRLKNNIAEHRDAMKLRNQMVAVFAGIAILFTAVSISMIVSSITRRIQSDGRRIGMLRAVGADENTILHCYTGQVSFSILAGYVLTSIILLLILFAEIFEGLEMFLGYGFVAMTVLAVLSWLICSFILRLRIRNIVSKSIIDNIREL